MPSKNKIALFDPSIKTDNLGDNIIMDEITAILGNLFPKAKQIRVSTRKRLNKKELMHINKSKIKIVCGTNLLSSHMLLYKQWEIGLRETKYLTDCILLGVGWWQYQSNPDFYTKFILKKVLSNSYLHAVRDKYTQEKLRNIGIKNTLVTGCPTIWNMTKQHCKSIPSKKSQKVIFTLTDYKKDKHNDKKLISILSKKYSNIYFWPQGKEDRNYLDKINKDEKVKIKLIPRNIKSFNDLLKKDNTDYIGTRLHAGIKAIRYKKRTIIISVDNRAEEMGKDFNLPVLRRDKIDFLPKLIESSFKTSINLPINNIKKWKKQFKSLK